MPHYFRSRSSHYFLSVTYFIFYFFDVLVVRRFGLCRSIQRQFAISCSAIVVTCNGFGTARCDFQRSNRVESNRVNGSSVYHILFCFDCCCCFSFAFLTGKSNETHFLIHSSSSFIGFHLLFASNWVAYYYFDLVRHFHFVVLVFAYESYFHFSFSFHVETRKAFPFFSLDILSPLSSYHFD